LRAKAIASDCAAALSAFAKCVPVTTIARALETKASSISLSSSALSAQRGEAARIGVDAGGGDALARALLADVAAHVLVADPGDEAALQAEPRGADRDVGRTAADRLGKARHVLQPAADLGAVEVDRRAADGDDVEGRLGHARQSLV
jgi:hypothetical protein